MPLNIPGLLAPFQLIVYPRLALPHLSVKDIRHLDFKALRQAGYRGAVFDKDNCLTIPHRDTLVPELTEAWRECLETFGEGNVIIVSNSAGTYLDGGGIQSESVSHHLQVPVLLHASFKPAYSCISLTRTYFSSLKSPLKFDELIIVGDRVFTDVIMANRMKKEALAKSRSLLNLSLSCVFEKSGTVYTEKETSGVEDPSKPKGPLAIWTTGIWKRESMLMRYVEQALVKSVQRWSRPGPDESVVDTQKFVKELPEPEPPKANLLTSLLNRSKRT